MACEVPHFHDGLLSGIVLGEDNATVYLSQVTGEEYTLTLSGLEVLHMEDFRQGNIISMVEVVSGRAPYEYIDLERLFEPPHPASAEEYHRAHAILVERQACRIASGEVTLLVIVPSYGADIIAICRQVTAAPREGQGS